jgi:hypothetical protein
MNFLPENFYGCGTKNVLVTMDLSVTSFTTMGYAE